MDVCAVNAATARCSRACPCVRAGRVAYARRSLCARECGGGRGVGWGGGGTVCHAQRTAVTRDCQRPRPKKEEEETVPQPPFLATFTFLINVSPGFE